MPRSAGRRARMVEEAGARRIARLLRAGPGSRLGAALAPPPGPPPRPIASEIRVRARIGSASATAASERILFASRVAGPLFTASPGQGSPRTMPLSSHARALDSYLPILVAPASSSGCRAGSPAGAPLLRISSAPTCAPISLAADIGAARIARSSSTAHHGRRASRRSGRGAAAGGRPRCRRQYYPRCHS